jgi:hypothetical protein
MTKKLSIASLVVAAAACSAFAFNVAPAKAACSPSNAVCTSFDPTQVANVVDYTGFAGSLTPPAGSSNQLTKAKVLFDFAGTWNPTFSITGISLSGPGITGSLSFSDVTLSTYNDPDFAETNLAALTTALTTVNFGTASPSPKLTFTIPAGAASAGASLTATIQYRNTNGQQVLTSGNNLVATASGGTAAVPGPLPLLGAGAAFAFSRRLRSRIVKSV